MNNVKEMERSRKIGCFIEYVENPEGMEIRDIKIVGEVSTNPKEDTHQIVAHGLLVAYIRMAGEFVLKHEKECKDPTCLVAVNHKKFLSLYKIINM